MDRLQFILLGFPVFLFCSDLVNLFAAPPVPSSRHVKPSSLFGPNPSSTSIEKAPVFPTTTQNPQVGVLGYGFTVEMKYCASCSYRGTAVTMEKMLGASFPGIHVILSNYPPAFPKRVLGKIVPVLQAGVIAIITAGDKIFPRLGMSLPPWYFTLRTNKFGAIASTWLLGNFLQTSLQSSGAFEVYCNGDLVFSKLNEQRFPSEIELRELIAKRLPSSVFATNQGRNYDDKRAKTSKEVDHTLVSARRKFARSPRVPVGRNAQVLHLQAIAGANKRNEPSGSGPEVYISTDEMEENNVNVTNTADCYSSMFSAADHLLKGS